MSPGRYGGSIAHGLGIRVMGKRSDGEMRRGVQAGICDESMIIGKRPGGKRINVPKPVSGANSP